MALQIETDAGLDPKLVEEGVWMEVLDQNDEPKFLNGDKNKPQRVLVRSNRCEAIKALSLRLQKRTAAMNRGRRKADQQIPNDEFIARQAAACVVELENFHKDHPKQRPTEDEMYGLFRDVRFEQLRDDVWNFSRDDANYFPAADSGKGAGDVSEGKKNPTSEVSSPAS